MQLVTDSNAFVESLFRTAKYRPEFPTKGFADPQEARLWAGSFVRWYNNDHHHSGIRYVSPAQRHAGLDRHILAASHELYRPRESHVSTALTLSVTIVAGLPAHRQLS